VVSLLSPASLADAEHDKPALEHGRQNNAGSLRQAAAGRATATLPISNPLPYNTLQRRQLLLSWRMSTKDFCDKSGKGFDAGL
jgi:hypothetical protein